MTKLHISPDLALPRDAVTQTMIVYGGKGMGKTNCATVLAEELDAAGIRYAVIDPMGVFWGLRHSKDGKGEGIQVLILGGKHGDIPIEPTGGQVCADLVSDVDANVIIDISRKPDGKMWSIGERIRFVADYCSRLYERQGERARPLMQIIDEAARFVPQQIQHGAVDVARCAGAVSVMVEEGRNVGIGVCLITQRSARMNKAVSELADCMIAFRTVGPLSIDAILDWFGEHVAKARWKELIEKLRALPRGHALIVSPGWLNFEGVARIRERNTFDSSATPKAGEERRASGKGAKPDLTPYLERMKATIEKAKADDPRELKKRIAELEKNLAAAGKFTVVHAPKGSTVDQSIVQRAANRAVAAATQPLIKMLRDAKRNAESALRELNVAVLSVQNIKDAQIPDVVPTPVDIPPKPIPAVTAAPTGRKERPEAVSAGPMPTNGDARLSKSQMELLRRLAQFRAIGKEPVLLSWLAGSLGTTVRSRGFEENTRIVKAHGLVIVEREQARLTDEGLTLIGEQTPLRGEELRSKVKEMLTSTQALYLEALCSEYPNAWNLEALANQFGTTVRARGFEENTRVLRANQLIEVQNGEAKAAQWLFA